MTGPPEEDRGASGTHPGPSPARPSRLPLLMLGLLTLVSFGGPFGILVVIRGGERPDWPPDRAVEWVTFASVCGVATALMIACLTVGIWSRGGASVTRRRRARS